MDRLPWGTKTVLTDEQFYNRQDDLDLLESLLKTTATKSPPTIMLTGFRGVGKTVLLKKIKKDLNKDYLINYIDLSQIPSYQRGNLSEIEIIQHFFTSLMESCKERGYNTINKKNN